MSDDEFAAAVERCEVPNQGFHHRDHLRLAWIYVRRYGPEEAGTRVAETIRRFAEHHGNPQRYHETVTQAWVRLLAPVDGESFQEVLAARPEFLDKELLRSYYSEAVLGSNEARMRFVEADLTPLP